jgi:putative membrane protein
VTLQDLPALNATLNACATVLLVLGRVQIARGRREAHARTMVAATLVSALFLAGYLTYHFVVVPELGHTEFRRTGFVRSAYYAMLISHVVLAGANLPLVIVTLLHAARGRLDRHMRLARWTWPIWLYVSVTGVLVYLCLYWWNPPAGLQ